MRFLSVTELVAASGGDGLDGITPNGTPIYSGPYTMPAPDLAPWYNPPPPHTEPIGPEQVAA